MIEEIIFFGEIMAIFKNLFLIFFIIFLLFFYKKNLYADTFLINLRRDVVKNNLNSISNRQAYALGISLGKYINHSVNEQKKLGVILNRDSLLLGIRDSILGRSVFSEKEITLRLIQLEKKLKCAEELILKIQAKNNKIASEKYIKKALTKNHFKKTSSGLIFFVHKKGYGRKLQDDDVVTVHYKGSLVNGSEFDNSYKRGIPVSFPLNSVILGWQEGLKYIRKGGKITLIIPQNLAYVKYRTSEISKNLIFIFEIELINVKHK